MIFSEKTYVDVLNKMEGPMVKIKDLLNNKLSYSSFRALKEIHTKMLEEMINEEEKSGNDYNKISFKNILIEIYLTTKDHYRDFLFHVEEFQKNVQKIKKNLDQDEKSALLNGSLNINTRIMRYPGKNKIFSPLTFFFLLTFLF